MNEPVGRGFQGFDLSNPATEPYARAVGAFLINCGGLELGARGWMHGLSADAELLGCLRHLRFGQRIEIIRKLIALGRVATSRREGADALWAAVARIAETRNIIAHNPVFVGWVGEERHGSADFHGVPDRRKLKQNDGQPAMLTLAEIDSAVDESAALAQKLFALADEIEAAEGWPAHQPSSGVPAT